MENQKSKRSLLGILIVIIALTYGISINTLMPLKEIVAEKISLVDKKGNTRLKLELAEGVPQVILAYVMETLLRMSEGELCFYDQGKRARIDIKGKDALDSSCISIKDQAGKKCLNLSAGPEGPYLSIEDNEEQREVVLSIDPIGSLNLIERSSGGRSPQLPRAKVTCPPENGSASYVGVGGRRGAER